MSDYRRSPSQPKLQVGSDGSVIGPSGKLLKHFPDKRGYRRVNVFLGHNQWKQLGVHFLVCEAFYGARPSRNHVVAHADGNPANNSADNLRWTTPKENEEDKRRHGRALLGERHHQSKLSESDVLAIRQRGLIGESLGSIARDYPVTRTAIHQIIRRKSWRHI